MREFFSENCSKFEQDFDNYQKQGETLEQYACYQEYKKRLEDLLSRFVQDENFDDEEECMFEIQRLVKEDLERHKEEMKKMMKALKKAQKRAMKAIKRAQLAAEGNLNDLESESDQDGDDSEDSDDADQKNGDAEGKGEDGGGSGRVPPMMVFFSPTTLEQLVEMVMNLGEYQTFSMMMRMKVQQNRVMKLLMEARGEGGLRTTQGELARVL